MSPARARGLCLVAGLGLPAATPAAPVAEAIDPARSEARIVVDMRVGGGVEGRFGQVGGELQPLADGRWRVQVRVDATSLSLDGPEWRQRLTRSEKFLDVQAHPVILFTSQPFGREFLSGGGRLAGELVLRGRERRVSFRLEPARCVSPGHDCPLQVRGQVRRREFGMEAYRVWVHDEVAFDFRVFLRHAGAP